MTERKPSLGGRWHGEAMRSEAKAEILLPFGFPLISQLR